MTGTGEAVLEPKADEYIEYAADYILGRNPLDVDPIMTDLFDRFAHAGGMSGVAVTAFSGIDVALHDAAGKLLEVPAGWSKTRAST
jgi:gluconate/galactonate dehydratase